MVSHWYTKQNFALNYLRCIELKFFFLPEFLHGKQVIPKMWATHFCQQSMEILFFKISTQSINIHLELPTALCGTFQVFFILSYAQCLQNTFICAGHLLNPIWSSAPCCVPGWTHAVEVLLMQFCMMTYQISQAESAHACKKIQVHRAILEHRISPLMRAVLLSERRRANVWDAEWGQNRGFQGNVSRTGRSQTGKPQADGLEVGQRSSKYPMADGLRAQQKQSASPADDLEDAEEGRALHGNRDDGRNL